MVRVLFGKWFAGVAGNWSVFEDFHSEFVLNLGFWWLKSGFLA